MSAKASVSHRVALLLAFLGPLAAHAVDEDATRSQAMKLGTAGAAAYKAERYPEALARFSEAYRVFPATTLLLNISRVQLKLGRCSEAIRYAERFRTAGNSEASPDAPEEWLANVRRSCIETEISSTPPNAAVWIDGERQSDPESTPWTGRLTVGRHKVLLWHPGFAQTERTFEVTADAPTHLALALSPATIPPPSNTTPAAELKPGQLKIVTEPAGADVSIDGVIAGHTPLRRQLDAGTYHLKLALQDFPAIEKEVVVEAGTETYDLEKFAQPRGELPAASAERAAQTSDMVFVPGGTFSMGAEDGEEDEKPVTQVRLSGFWMDRTEVTVTEYRRCFDAGKCTAPDSKLLCNWGQRGRAAHPSNCVDWSQAKTFCNWAGKRLPTEAEWEYAARGKDEATYPWGEAAPTAKRVQWYGATGTAVAGSHPAGETALGLRDMAGNVWEWVEDAYAPYPGGSVTNPRQETGTSHVSRGGSWSTFEPSWLRGADRSETDPNTRTDDLGFRCVRGS